jgi:hypothetical protein
MKGIYKLGAAVLVLLAITSFASAFTEIGDNIIVANNVTAQNILGNLSWVYLFGIPADFPNSTIAGYNGNFPNSTVAGYGSNFPNTSLPNYLLINTYNGNFPNSTVADYGSNFPNTSLPNYLLISTYGGNFPNSTISTKTTLAQVNSSAQIGESQVTNLVTDLTGKEPTITGSTSNTFWNGIKQFVTLSSGLITDFSAAVRSNISSSGGLLSYNSSTGVISDTINQSANLYNVNGSNITTGTIPTARYMDAVNSSALLASIAQVTGLQGDLDTLNTTKANKTNVGEFTGGNLSVNRLDGGVNASITTFWRGDGTWSEPNYRHLVTLNSDVSSAASLNFQDVTGLSFPVTTGTTYRFKATIIYTAVSAANGGSRWAVNGPASPTLLAYNSAWALTATTGSFTNAAAYDTGTVSASAATITGNIATVEGIIKPSADGTVIVRFAGERATANDIVVKAGSTLEWW